MTETAKIMGASARKAFWAVVIAAFLTGCGTAPVKPVGEDDPDLDEAMSDMEESKAEYQACLRDQDEYDEMDCEPFKEMYEEDREAYEQMAKAKNARR